MIDWLLKEDEKKNKVGRPKLADDKLLRRSRIMLIASILVVVSLSFVFGCYVQKVSPLTTLYKMTIGKILGPINNKNGFIIKEYYNDDQDYVMNVKITNKLRNKSASYKYTTYYLNKNYKWIKYDSKTYENDTNSFNIIFESKKNKNITWKVKLQLVNASKIERDYTPYDWSFNSSSTIENNYAYKMLTVKGYYSPVPYSEIKKQNDEKVYVYTTKNNPRVLNIKAPSSFVAKIKYNNAIEKEDYVETKKSNNNDETYFKIPNMNATTNVKVYVWVDGYDKSDLKSVKLDNWETKIDSNGNYYITNSYMVIPSKAYKN